MFCLFLSYYPHLILRHVYQLELRWGTIIVMNWCFWFCNLTCLANIQIISIYLQIFLSIRKFIQAVVNLLMWNHKIFLAITSPFIIIYSRFHRWEKSSSSLTESHFLIMIASFFRVVCKYKIFAALLTIDCTLITASTIPWRHNYLTH